ncbi:MAG: hypothetical protein HY331_16905 [Chloroflexi bacterium]|nr:hypothetical protein [Chloroflexota bacterium]
MRWGFMVALASSRRQRAACRPRRVLLLIPEAHLLDGPADFGGRRGVAQTGQVVGAEVRPAGEEVGEAVDERRVEERLPRFGEQARDALGDEVEAAAARADEDAFFDLTGLAIQSVEVQGKAAVGRAG